MLQQVQHLKVHLDTIKSGVALNLSPMKTSLQQLTYLPSALKCSVQLNKSAGFKTGVALLLTYLKDFFHMGQASLNVSKGTFYFGRGCYSTTVLKAASIYVQFITFLFLSCGHKNPSITGVQTRGGSDR